MHSCRVFQSRMLRTSNAASSFPAMSRARLIRPKAAGFTLDVPSVLTVAECKTLTLQKWETDAVWPATVSMRWKSSCRNGLGRSKTCARHQARSWLLCVFSAIFSCTFWRRQPIILKVKTLYRASLSNIFYTALGRNVPYNLAFFMPTKHIESAKIMT